MLHELSVALAGLLAVFLFVRYRITRRTVHDIRGPPSKSWLLGHLVEIAHQKDVGELDFKWVKEYGKIAKIADCFGKDTLFIADPKAIQHIFHTCSYHSPKPTDVRVNSKLFGGRGIAGQQGADHQRHRKILNPAFAAPRLKMFLPVFRRVARTMTEKWTDLFSQFDTGKAQVIDIAPWLTKTTLDAIGETAFDYDFGALQSRQSELGNAYHNLFAETQFEVPKILIFFRGLWLYLPNAVLDLIKYLPAFKRIQSYMQVATKVANELIDEKQQVYLRGGKGNDDIVSILVRANAKEDPRGQLDGEELIGQIVTLLLAGHETTATMLAWTLYELSKHPEIQEKMREEIRAARASLKDGETDFSISDLDSMHYLNAVIKESLRFHPIAFHLIRETDRDDILPLSEPITSASGRVLQDVPVSKGQRFFVSISAYHRLTEVWGADADIWNPARFLDERKGDLPPTPPVGVFANLMSFSAGPQSCIGWRFALIELQAFICEFVENFEFAPLPGVDIRRAAAEVMTPMVKGKEHEGTQLPLLVSLVE